MAGLLSDVLPFLYSQGDRAKRYIGGLLGDPVGTAQQYIGNLNDQAGVGLGLLHGSGAPWEPTNAAREQLIANLAQMMPIAGMVRDIPAPRWNRDRQSIPLADWTANEKPVMSEIRELLRDQQSKSAGNTLRTLRNTQTGAIQYAWPADAALHQDIGAYLGLRPGDWAQGIIAP